MADLHQEVTCPGCRYFERIAEGHGECRRYAPHPNVPLFIPKAESSGMCKTDIHWPKVYDRNWCGEFASRVETA